MSLSPQLLEINLAFLKRVDIKGEEVPAFVALSNELNAQLQATKAPAEVPAEDPEES
jgi:hypothetical protein